jgi:hypothetical protein
MVGDVVVEPGAVVRRSTVFGPGADRRRRAGHRRLRRPLHDPGQACAAARRDRVRRGRRRTTIRDVGARIQGSLIGEDVFVEGVSTRPSTHRMVVGDKSRIELQQ